MKNARALLAASLLLLPSGAFAQTADPRGDALMRALLEEMRLLRATIQKNAAADIRARTMLERLRLQQDTVRELQREVEQRQTETEFRMDYEPFDEMMANAETRMKEAPDDGTKKQIEQEITGLKRRKEMETRNRQRMEVRFRRQEQRLEEETARLRTIEDDLRRLEQQLAPEPPKNPE
jgi:hypothetical protein